MVENQKKNLWKLWKGGAKQEAEINRTMGENPNDQFTHATLNPLEEKQTFKYNTKITKYSMKVLY